MSLLSLVVERRPVLVAGRRYLVRRPTIATVELFLEVFRDEVGILSGVDPDETTLVPEIVLPMFLIAPQRAERVLRSCVESDEPGPWPVRELAEALLGSCDLSRIVSSLGIRRLGPDEEAPDPDVHRTAIVRAAVKFGVTPFEIMEWPYEGYLDVIGVLPKLEGVPEEIAGGHDSRFLDLVRAHARPVEPN